jgi:hypothetical protein
MRESALEATALPRRHQASHGAVILMLKSVVPPEEVVGERGEVVDTNDGPREA